MPLAKGLLQGGKVALGVKMEETALPQISVPVHQSGQVMTVAPQFVRSLQMI